MNSSNATVQAELSVTDYIFLDVLYLLTFISTITGNVLILMCLTKFRDHRSNIHILIGNLAVSDLIVGVVLMPYCIVMDILKMNSDKNYCLLKACFTNFAVGGTCYGLLLISIDRFSAVCSPFHHSRNLSPTRIILLILVGWVYVSILAYYPLVDWQTEEGTLPFNCKADQALPHLYQRIAHLNFVFILVLNVTLYAIVLRIAMKKAKQVYADETLSYQIRSNLRELHKVKTMAIVQGLFIICWFPYTVMSTIGSIASSATICRIQYWCLVPGVINSSFNWIVYGYRNRQLGARMKLYMKCACKKTNI